LKSARTRVRRESIDALRMREGNESRKGTRIPIDKIANVFDNSIIPPAFAEDGVNGENTQYYDDDDDDEEDVDRSEAKGKEEGQRDTTESPILKNEKKEILTQRLIIEPISQPRTESTLDMDELVAMEAQAKIEGSSTGIEDKPQDRSSTNIEVASSVSVIDNGAEVKKSSESDDYDLSLDKALDSERAATVRRSMSIKSSTAVRAGEQIRRMTKYDPNDYYRPDPMAYGAYRRWQVDNDEENDSRKASAGGRSTSKSGRRGTGSKGKVTKDGKKPKGGGDTNSFYKAIKKLGSGPKGDGESTGTGVADPEKGMKNVNLGKPPDRARRTKRTVTAQDIDSIFKETAGGPSEEESDKDEYQGIDCEEADSSIVPLDEGAALNDVNAEAQTTLMLGDSSINLLDEAVIAQEASSSVNLPAESDISVDALASEEVPKWLKEADKDAKKSLRAKGKKKRKLTDDWRFWAAIIASVGFASAFFTMQGSNTNINVANPIERKDDLGNNGFNEYKNRNRDDLDELVI